MTKYYVIESVANPGSFFPKADYGKFKAYFYAYKMTMFSTAEKWLPEAIEMEKQVKITEVYE